MRLRYKNYCILGLNKPQKSSCVPAGRPGLAAVQWAPGLGTGGQGGADVEGTGTLWSALSRGLGEAPWVGWFSSSSARGNPSKGSSCFLLPSSPLPAPHSCSLGIIGSISQARPLMPERLRASRRAAGQWRRSRQPSAGWTAPPSCPPDVLGYPQEGSSL